MDSDDQGLGSIHAKRIQADNVGAIQIQGADAEQAALFLRTAKELRLGKISADDIIAKNLGLLQYLNPAHPDTNDLRRELAALREKVEKAIEAQEIPDADDADDARKSLEAAESELTKAQPRGDRVVRKLDEANSVLTKCAQAAAAAGKLGAQIIKLATTVATVWQVAQHLFGL